MSSGHLQAGGRATPSFLHDETRSKNKNTIMSKQFQNLNDKIIERDKIDTLAQKYTIAHI